jgi:chemotaxis protein methyltransferase CheR
MSNRENEKIEIKLLLQAIYLKYGYDFRSYSKASVKRRILHRLSVSGLKTISEIQHKILNDEQFFSSLLSDLSINVTEMFREPRFFRALREKVIPGLKILPFIKVWHAGCATGEEVYSLAIVMKEEGLYDKTQIYATDFNEEVIEKAKEGIYPIDGMKEYTENYKRAGGLASFADYYTARYDHAIMENSLKEHIVFSDHNLATDSVFGEMNLILCRNVLIYFNRQLQDRVIKLFTDSLCDAGFLCLGSKESIRFSKYSDDFEDVAMGDKIYRKKLGD